MRKATTPLTRAATPTSISQESVNLNKQQTAAALEASAAELRAPAGETPASVDDLKAQTEAAKSVLNKTEAAATALLALDAKVPAAELALRAAETAIKIAEEVDQQAQNRLQQLIGLVSERQAGVPAELSDATAAATSRRQIAPVREHRLPLQGRSPKHAYALTYSAPRPKRSIQVPTVQDATRGGCHGWDGYQDTENNGTTLSECSHDAPLPFFETSAHDVARLSQQPMRFWPSLDRPGLDPVGSHRQQQSCDGGQ